MFNEDHVRQVDSMLESGESSESICEYLNKCSHTGIDRRWAGIIEERLDRVHRVVVASETLAGEHVIEGGLDLFLRVSPEEVWDPEEIYDPTDYEDRRIQQSIQRTIDQINRERGRDTWQWCHVEMTAIHKGRTATAKLEACHSPDGLRGFLGSDDFELMRSRVVRDLKTQEHRQEDRWRAYDVEADDLDGLADQLREHPGSLFFEDVHKGGSPSFHLNGEEDAPHGVVMVPDSNGDWELVDGAFTPVKQEVKA